MTIVVISQLFQFLSEMINPLAEIRKKKNKQTHKQNQNNPAWEMYYCKCITVKNYQISFSV